MNIRSLVLGSVALAGISTGAHAADLGVLTSLDVCDALGLSGLTISSDTNCLQISGGVDYRFRIGDYGADTTIARNYDGNFNVITPDAVRGERVDWETRVRTYLRIVASADSDFGPAQAIIRLREIDEVRFRNGGLGANGLGDDTGGPFLEEAYLRIGDSTVLMAGRRLNGVGGSIARIDDDASLAGFSFMGDTIDGGGVLIDGDDRRLGNHVIQVVTDLGNGFDAGIALENIDGRTGGGGNYLGSGSNADASGTAIGVLGYKGETVSAHITGIAYGVLDGQVEAFAVHAGATGTFENFQVRAAIGYDSNFKPYTNIVPGPNTIGVGAPGSIGAVLHGLLTGQATFDIFTLAATGQFASHQGATDFELSGRAGVEVTDGITLNLQGTYFRDSAPVGLDTFRAQADARFAVTETLALTAAVGGFFGSGVAAGNAGDNTIFYGAIGAQWNPGGNFSSEINLEANDLGAVRSTLSASKTFE